jgi:hypothetical protein
MPWFTKGNAWGCATQTDLGNLRSNIALDNQHSLQERTPVNCHAYGDGIPVVEITSDGWMQPDYQVRLRSGETAWFPAWCLRN